MVQDYASLDRRLREAGGTVSAAEAHGLLCALLCGDGSSTRESWVSELLQDLEGSDLLPLELRRSLDSLYQETAAALEDVQLSFVPFGPADDRTLRARAEALVEWCQGFLYGLGLLGVPQHRFSEAGREALEDFSRLLRMDLGAVAESEEDERDFTAVLEFVRVAALLIYQDLRSGNEVRT